MIKLPQKSKIAESYTAIADNRIVILKNEAFVKSSNGEKEYLIKWKDNSYYSNDNSTYWQETLGYPVIAVLMLQNKLTLNKDILQYFKNINWNKLNKENKRDYNLSLEMVLKNLSNDEKEMIYNEINKVYEEIKILDIELTRKKNFD